MAAPSREKPVARGARRAEASGGLTLPEPPALYENVGEPTPESQIDRYVFGRLKRLNIQPSPLCSDAVFVRRVYLDIIGTLPTLQEAKDFLLDQNLGKRRILIDRLLEREEFADYWAMKWSDLLRVKAEFPINLWPNAAQAYHHWIRASLRENKPYDRFVREMLVAGGSNFRVPEVNFYRAVQGRDPQAIAQAVALTFMGTRFDKWPKDRQAGMAVFFSQLSFKATAEWKEEIVFYDSGKASGGAPQVGGYPDGAKVQLPAGRDPRGIFADWLIDPKNPWFARNIVNRCWAWLLGRGIIHEPDDNRPDNPPSNAELLAYLERFLVANRYDLKQVFRLILNSKTYQLSSIPRKGNAESAANFGCYALRRLEAEVLIDALCQITGTTEQYSSPIPEPFTYIPEDQRSIALADGSITSSFLEMFGRSPRDTGQELERNNKPSAAQRLHMLNSSHIQKKLEQGKLLQAVSMSRANPREAIDGLYLTILSRYPTQKELTVVGTYSRSGSVNGREALIDMAWALINSAEFLYRH